MRTFFAAQRGVTFPATCTLVSMSCPNCGISYAIPEALRAQAQAWNRAEYPNDYLSWSCPNGHKLSYPGRNREQELERDLRRARDRAATQAHLKEQAQRREQAQRGAATRARNERDTVLKKVANGICPVKGCGRHFKQVRRHIASQHPDFEIPDPVK